MMFIAPEPQIPTWIAKNLKIPAYPLAKLREEQLKINQHLENFERRQHRRRLTDPEWMLYQQLLTLQQGIATAITMFLPFNQRMEALHLGSATLHH